MQVSYDPLLIVLSVIIAVFGAYTCFQMGARLALMHGAWRRTLLAGAAVAMGGGIWSMHFVGMLALNLPVIINYDALLTLVSALVSILMTGIALFFSSIGARTPLKLAGGGLFMGLGISSMHYVGMAAIRANCIVTYSPSLVAASVVVGILASTAALWLAFNLKRGWHMIPAAIVMGFAVSGMHYTAMAAASFLPVPADVEIVLESPALSQPLLAILVAVATFLIFGFALLAAIPEPPAVAAVSQGERPEDAGEVAAPAGGGEGSGRLVKLPVTHNKATLLLNPDDVICIKAEAHYTTVYTPDGGFFCALSVSALEQRLDPDVFLRVHRSHIVNMRHAKSFERLNEQAVIVLGEDETARRIPVSRGKVRQLKTALGV